MKKAMQPFTVIGVGSGAWCPRVHKHVQAFSVEEAVLAAVGDLNNCESTGGDERINLVGAAVFRGHVPSLLENLGRYLNGDDRSAGTKVERKNGKRFPYTVVTLDPATNQVGIHHLLHATAANAERNPALDFFLIGGVMATHMAPIHIYQPAGVYLPTSRKERVLALANKYSSGYARFLDSSLPIEAPYN